MSNSIAPGSSADVNVKVTALTTNPNVPVTYKTIILKKNLINGVNTLTQEMMSASNTKYVIKYDYVFGENITIPANCILKFDGGSLSSGSLVCKNTIIYGQKGAFKDIRFSGTIKEFKVSWLNLYSDYNAYNIKVLHDITSICENVIWDVKEIYVKWEDNSYIKLHEGVNDFGNTIFNILSKDINFRPDLFKYHKETTLLNESTLAAAINNSVFTNAKGCLVVADDNPIVAERYGFPEEVVKRADILFIQNNVAFNDTILPYDSDADTIPVFSYFPVDYEGITIKNAIIIRDDNCNFNNVVVNVENGYNVRIENMSVHIPQSTLIEDRMLRVVNCYNLTFENITTNASYSYNSWGYVYSLNNIANLYCRNLQSTASWGVIGTACINSAYIENSSINRYDTHYYCKDLLFKKCVFSNKASSYSICLGYVKYEDCIFRNYIPFRVDDSYHALTEHTLIYDNCKFYGCNQLWWGVNSVVITDEERWPRRAIIHDLYVPVMTIRNCEVYNVSIITAFTYALTTYKNTLNFAIDGLKLDNGNDNIGFVFAGRVIDGCIIKINRFYQSKYNDTMNNAYHGLCIATGESSYPTNSLIEVTNSFFDSYNLLQNIVSSTKLHIINSKVNAPHTSDVTFRDNIKIENSDVYFGMSGSSQLVLYVPCIHYKKCNLRSLNPNLEQGQINPNNFTIFEYCTCIGCVKPGYFTQHISQMNIMIKDKVLRPRGIQVLDSESITDLMGSGSGNIPFIEILNTTDNTIVKYKNKNFLRTNGLFSSRPTELLDENDKGYQYFCNDASMHYPIFFDYNGNDKVWRNSEGTIVSQA